MLPLLGALAYGVISAAAGAGLQSLVGKRKAKENNEQLDELKRAKEQGGLPGLDRERGAREALERGLLNPIRGMEKEAQARDREMLAATGGVQPAEVQERAAKRMANTGKLALEAANMIEQTDLKYKRDQEQEIADREAQRAERNRTILQAGISGAKQGVQAGLSGGYMNQMPAMVGKAKQLTAKELTDAGYSPELSADLVEMGEADPELLELMTRRAEGMGTSPDEILQRSVREEQTRFADEAKVAAAQVAAAKTPEEKARAQEVLDRILASLSYLPQNLLP